MKKTETIQERITRYERMLDRAEQAVSQAEAALEAYDEIRDDIAVLETYYSGPEWKADFEADEAGLLPADLKRGVLSEDGIDHVLERYAELRQRIIPKN